MHNLKVLKSLLKKNTKFLAVVKANAYGHGILKVAKVLEPHVDFFGVHSAQEAYTLLKSGIDKNILILGPVFKNQFQMLNPAKVHLTCSSLKLIEDLKDSGFSFPLHLKVETGTFRQGFLPEELKGVLKILKKYKIPITGFSTHFANIEDTIDHSYAKKQLKKYLEVRETIENSYGKLQYYHTACSAAILLFPETHFNLVRAGISLYGYWPSKEVKLSWKHKYGENGPTLKPVLSWKTYITEIKKAKKGSYIGYGCTFRTTRDTKVAVLPVGYYDGYDRKLSNKGIVLIRGQRSPIIGRICMNLCMVDVTDIEGAKIGDIVTLIGEERDEKVTADTLAEISGTINYEILSRISPHIPRILI